MKIIDGVLNHGWLWIVAYVYPVYWSQDKTRLHPDGIHYISVLSLRPTGQEYYRGTHGQRQQWFKLHGG